MARALPMGVETIGVEWIFVRGPKDLGTHLNTGRRSSAPKRGDT